MVKESIQQGRSKCAVVVEDFRPFFENPIAGDDKQGLFVAVADNLKE